MQKRGVTVFMGVAALLVTACGGGGDDGGGSASKATTTVAKTLTAKEVFEIAAPATVALSAMQGKAPVYATGIIFDAAKGLILTNAHFVAGTAAQKVRVGDQAPVPARVLGVAPCEDVAVMQFATVPPGLKELKFGSSATIGNQDQVYALGFPGTAADIATQKVVSTSGTVQSPDVAIEIDGTLPRYSHTIQHAAIINPGSSGGPLLDEKAQVIGVNTSGNATANQYYAISIDHIKPMLADLTAGKSQADVGWDLAPFADVPLSEVFEATGYGTAEQGAQADRLLVQLGIDGLFVFGSSPGSPAEEAEIEGGDLLETINNVPVTSFKDVCDVLQSASPGQVLEVEGRWLVSGGGEQDFGDQWTTKVTV